MRINKFIASNSEFSRRKADEYIQAGKVFVNEIIVTKLGTIIDPINDQVKIDNQIISTKNEKIYLALNKPIGYISTRKDEFNRKTVLDLVPENKNLKPVGRLDKDTEGLLLLSNDGEFLNQLTHPKFECEKEYFLTIEGRINQRNINLLENGININYKKTSKAKIEIIEEDDNETNLKITIHEGRNRQIRKMFASISHPVKYLKRIRIGNIHLKTLKPGDYRLLTKQELNAYKLA